MRFRRAAWIVCAAALGCSPGPTTLLIDVDAVPGVTVTSLTLHVGLSGDAGVTAALPASGAVPALPGQVVVKLADQAMDVDLSLDGQDASDVPVHAGRTVHVVPHEQTRTSLTLGKVTVVDLGDDGAADGGDGGCSLGARCVYAHQRLLTITNGGSTALPAGYTVRVPIGAMVLPPGSVRADLDDLRLFGTAGELPRVIDLAPPGETRALWFALTQAIAAGASDSSYALYYGDPSAGAPPADPSQVFALWDGFDNGAQLSSLWLSNGAPTVGSGTITFHQGGTDAVTTNAATDGLPTLSALEWRARITDPASAAGASTYYYWCGYQRQGDFTASDPWVVWISRAPNEIHGERKVVTGGTSCMAGCNGPTAVADTAFHTFRIERGPTSSRFYRDGILSYAADDPNAVDYSVLLRNYSATSDLIVDFIRGRALAAPEPTVAVGPELPVP